MKGYAVFAPVLGLAMLTLAIVWASHVANVQGADSERILKTLTRNTEKTLPVLERADIFSYYIVRLRHYFYERQDYLNFAPDQIKNTILTVLRESMGTKNNPVIINVPEMGLQIDHYVEGSADLTDATSVTWDGKKITLKIDGKKMKKTFAHVTAKDLHSGVQISDEKLRLFDSNVQVHVFIPLEAVIKHAGEIKDELLKLHAIAGFYRANCINESAPFAAVFEGSDCSGVNVGELKHKIKQHTIDNVNFSDVQAIAGDETLKSLIAARIKNKMPYVESVEFISVDKAEAGGIAKYFVLCADGNLAKALGKVCVLLSEDNAKYSIYKSAKIAITEMASNNCAPGGSVEVRYKIDVDFNSEQLLRKKSNLQGKNTRSGTIKGCMQDQGSDIETIKKAYAACQANCVKEMGNLMTEEECIASGACTVIDCSQNRSQSACQANGTQCKYVWELNVEKAINTLKAKMSSDPLLKRFSNAQGYFSAGVNGGDGAIISIVYVNAKTDTQGGSHLLKGVTSGQKLLLCRSDGTCVELR